MYAVQTAMLHPHQMQQMNMGYPIQQPYYQQHVKSHPPQYYLIDLYDNNSNFFQITIIRPFKLYRKHGFQCIIENDDDLIDNQILFDQFGCKYCYQKMKSFNQFKNCFIYQVQIVSYQEPDQYAYVQQEPVLQEPVQQEPVLQEPVLQEPVQQEPVLQEPVQQEHVQQEHVKQEPVLQEPVQLSPNIMVRRITRFFHYIINRKRSSFIITRFFKFLSFQKKQYELILKKEKRLNKKKREIELRLMRAEDKKLAALQKKEEAKNEVIEEVKLESIIIDPPSSISDVTEVSPKKKVKKSKKKKQSASSSSDSDPDDIFNEIHHITEGNKIFKSIFERLCGKSSSWSNKLINHSDKDIKFIQDECIRSIERNLTKEETIEYIFDRFDIFYCNVQIIDISIFEVNKIVKEIFGFPKTIKEEAIKSIDAFNTYSSFIIHLVLGAFIKNKNLTIELSVMSSENHCRLLTNNFIFDNAIKIIIALCKEKILSSNMVNKKYITMPPVDIKDPFIECVLIVCSDFFDSLNNLPKIDKLTTKKCYMINCMSIFLNKQMYSEDCLNFDECYSKIRNKTIKYKDILRTPSFEDAKSPSFYECRVIMKMYFDLTSNDWDSKNILVKQNIIEEPLRLRDDYNSEEFKKNLATPRFLDKSKEKKMDIISIVQTYDSNPPIPEFIKLKIAESPTINAEFTSSINNYCASILQKKNAKSIDTKKTETKENIEKLTEFRKYNEYMKELSIDEKKYLFDKFKQLPINEFLVELNRVKEILHPSKSEVVHIVKEKEKKITLNEKQINLLADIVITELRVNLCPPEIVNSFKYTWKRLYDMSFCGFDGDSVREDIFGLYYDVILMTSIKLNEHYSSLIDKMRNRLDETYYDNFTKNMIEVRHFIYVIISSINNPVKEKYVSIELSKLVNTFVLENFNKRISFNINFLSGNIDKLFSDFNKTIEENCSIICQKYDYMLELDSFTVSEN